MVTIAGPSLTLVLPSVPGPRFPVSLIAYGMPNAEGRQGCEGPGSTLSRRDGGAFVLAISSLWNA